MVVVVVVVVERQRQPQDQEQDPQESLADPSPQTEKWQIHAKQLGDRTTHRRLVILTLPTASASTESPAQSAASTSIELPAEPGDSISAAGVKKKPSPQ